jgi:hypothetical protein
MTLKSLTLGTCEPEGVSVDLSDERQRVEAGAIVNRDAIASVTLDTDLDGGQSWGEFLTFADVAALHAWTGALLADAWDSKT